MDKKMKIIIIISLFILSGCEILKSKRTSRIDSTGSSRIDSGRVVKSDGGSKRDSTYFRETIYFGRDTNVFNTTTPVNNYYPTQIVRESGTVSRDEWLRLLDSANKTKVDTSSKAVTVEEKSKKSETKGVGLITMILIAVGMVILNKSLGLFQIKLKK
jgi:hypothetical protein